MHCTIFKGKTRKLLEESQGPKASLECVAGLRSGGHHTEPTSHHDVRASIHGAKLSTSLKSSKKDTILELAP